MSIPKLLVEIVPSYPFTEVQTLDEMVHLAIQGKPISYRVTRIPKFTREAEVILAERYYHEYVVKHGGHQRYLIPH